MKYPATTLLFLCLLLPAAGNANNETKPKQDPAQAVNQPPAADKAPATPASTPSRGQLLYENHCTKCHESLVHIRANRKSKSISDVQGWVSNWQVHEKLQWSTKDINDVTEYLIDQYYKFK
jgi:mono/diheme cytochrome c family protein